MNKEMKAMFDDAVRKATVIPFDLNWSNGIGEFDNAIYTHPVKINNARLGNGQLATAVTPGKRNILFIGTRLGTLILFERRDPATSGMAVEQEDVLFLNTTAAIRQTFGLPMSGMIDHVDLETILGYNDIPNIGRRIEDINSFCKKNPLEAKAA